MPRQVCLKTKHHYSKKGKGKRSETPVVTRTDVEREQDEIKGRQRQERLVDIEHLHEFIRCEKESSKNVIKVKKIEHLKKLQ